jgi:hypothetical protein
MSWEGNLPLIILLSHIVAAREYARTVALRIRACVSESGDATRDRERRGRDFKERSGFDATEYIIDSFLSTCARLKSRSLAFVLT